MQHEKNISHRGEIIKNYTGGVAGQRAGEKEIMKIKVDTLNNILAKVNAAVGSEDQLRFRFFPMTQGEQVVNVCEFLAYSKGLQVMQMVPYSGKAVTDKETVFVVKASAFTGIIRSYLALGIEDVTIEANGTVLVIKNASGQATLPTTSTMPVIDMNETQKGAAWQVLVNTKEIGTAVRNVAATIGAGADATNGIYFSATESGYRLLTTNTYSGSSSSVKGEFRPMTKEAKTKDFFVAGGLQKALAVLKGEQLNLVVAAKYLIIKDGEGTFAVIALNESEFPKDAMLKVMTNASEPTSLPETFIVKAKKSVIEAAISLAEVTDPDKVKTLTLTATQMGDKAELVTGTDTNPQTVRADVSIVSADVKAAKLSLGTAIFRTVLGNAGDDVKLRFTSGYVLIYDGNSEAPLSWAFKRNTTPKKEEAEANKEG